MSYRILEVNAHMDLELDTSAPTLEMFHTRQLVLLLTQLIVKFICITH